ncbi:AsnC family transcriptional regulator [Hyella patelloides LEGE 07179]|uniref:AsnC family transcriptional regulator n=1 Tax=Hyella patelloides LEGE 07179 TaxID=945734 RepID=A0A563VMU4_9CYAN|nr:Lrp/AsnC family transcriptional regulator [Hyella patelloides]VEP12605.1 AsnC family transcriptional regulator [Hyella patelloides LEGE 07179]
MASDRQLKLLDKTSWQILAILQENARIPFKELGKQVRLSAPAVAERVRRLEEAGIITRYRAELNLEKLGLSIMAFVTFRSFPDKCEELKLLLHESPEVQSSYRITGSDHYLAKVSVTSVGHLEQLVDRFITYSTVTTSIVLSTPISGRVIDDEIFPEVVEK